MRKRVAIVLSIFLTISSSIQANAINSNALPDGDYLIYHSENQTITYHSYEDLPEVDDGGASPGYFPQGIVSETPAADVDTRAVVGLDDRVVVNPTNVGPYCNTVYVESTFPDDYEITVSGFMLGPSAVLTCAHCVYDNNRGGLATSVRVVPAKNGDIEPYGSADMTSIVVPTEYTNSQDGDSRYDWAIIVIDEPLGNTTGWLGLKWQTASYVGTEIKNTGYPAYSGCARQNEDGTLMILAEGEIRDDNNTYLDGDWDASGNNSGGPVFAYYSDTGYTAIGILSAGSISENLTYPNSFSRALRISEDMYDLFVQYR